MEVIRVRNVAEALPAGLEYLARAGRWENSRAGRVLVAPGPVTTVYERPRERVLFSAVRDANPFFHIAESLWLLAGRNDVAFLNNFVRDFGERFGEEDGTEHDAYGHRWRKAFGFDQLDAVVRQLSENPESRQAVVQMWDATSTHDVFSSTYRDYEGERGEDDLRGEWRTRPCNTHAYLRIRDQPDEYTFTEKTGSVLDITVLCRSNDIVWGAYGANAVQFSVLQEYLAARLDVGVGRYYQISNNYHCYEDQFQKLNPGRGPEVVESLRDNRYEHSAAPFPLVHDAETFDRELKYLLELYEILDEGPPIESAHYCARQLHNRFLSHVVWPMLMSHYSWRVKKDIDAARKWCDAIQAADWQLAAREWIERRVK